MELTDKMEPLVELVEQDLLELLVEQEQQEIMELTDKMEPLVEQVLQGQQAQQDLQELLVELDQQDLQELLGQQVYRSYR